MADTTQNLPQGGVWQYVNADLFVELGIDSWPQDTRTDFLERFGNILIMRLANRLLAGELSEEQKDQLETLLSRHPNDGQSLWMFLSAEIDNLDQIVNEELGQLKKQLIALGQMPKMQAAG